MRKFAVPLIATMIGSLAMSGGCKTTESNSEEADKAEGTGTLSADEQNEDESKEASDRDREREAGEIWEPETGDFVLEDEETGSRWNVRGEAYAGPLKGEKLQQIPAFNSFWFAWSSFYHGSEVWQAEGAPVRNEPGPIPEGEQCEVPCERIKMGCPGKDCIPALDYAGREFAGRERPREAEMVEPGESGTDYLTDDTFVFGVVVDGEPRAYPHNIYWRHEIHNDRVGDTEFSVSFCPLTGSGIAFPGMFDDRPIRFGVSGRLFQANLVMFDPRSETFWSQMLLEGIKGEHRGRRLEPMPIVETTWERWQEMYPETLVTSSKTGYGSGYDRYPYGNYREPTSDSWGGTRDHDDRYPPKVRTLGLPADSNDESVAYPFPELHKLEGDRNVVHDEFQGDRIAVVYEAEHRMAIPFRASADGEELTFSVTEAE